MLSLTRRVILLDPKKYRQGTVFNLQTDRDSRRFGWVISSLAVLVPASLVISASAGSIAIDWSVVVETIRTGRPSLDHTIVFELRLPRAVSALVVGASLSLAGVLMQALLRNPLADPYVLGTSGGAAVFALIVLLLGLPYQTVSLAAAAEPCCRYPSSSFSVVIRGLGRLRDCCSLALWWHQAGAPLSVFCFQ